MRILALENELPDADSKKIQPLLIPEALRVWELYQLGIIREMFFRQDRHLSVLVLECETEAEAVEWLSSLPLVKQKLIGFEVIPLVPYPGFSRLFIPVKQETAGGNSYG
jgi:hypothetical protein